MSTQSIIACNIGVISNLLPRQSATVAASVAAAIRVEQPNLATFGRRMAGPTTAKSVIKRAWRFTDNHRVGVADAMAGRNARALHRRDGLV